MVVVKMVVMMSGGRGEVAVMVVMVMSGGRGEVAVMEAIISMGRGEMIHRHTVKFPAEIPSAKPTRADASKGRGG